ncbi:MAG: twin-arginine translocase TatA/TatE family subunit [Algisphaera sp.]
MIPPLLAHHDAPHTLIAFLGNIGPWQLAVLAILGVLIFGKRLPEVGKSLGKGIVEFKKGLSGIEEDLQQPNTPAPNHQLTADQPAPTPPPAPSATPLATPETREETHRS